MDPMTTGTIIGELETITNVWRDTSLIDQISLVSAILSELGVETHR